MIKSIVASPFSELIKHHRAFNYLIEKHRLLIGLSKVMENDFDDIIKRQGVFFEQILLFKDDR